YVEPKPTHGDGWASMVSSTHAPTVLGTLQRRCRRRRNARNIFADTEECHPIRIRAIRNADLRKQPGRESSLPQRLLSGRRQVLGLAQDQENRFRRNYHARSKLGKIPVDG